MRVVKVDIGIPPRLLRAALAAKCRPSFLENCTRVLNWMRVAGQLDGSQVCEVLPWPKDPGSLLSHRPRPQLNASSNYGCKPRSQQEAPRTWGRPFGKPLTRLSGTKTGTKNQAGVPTDPLSRYVSTHGGLDLIGKAAVLKTAGRNPFRVRIPGPPLSGVAIHSCMTTVACLLAPRYEHSMIVV